MWDFANLSSPYRKQYRRGNPFYYHLAIALVFFWCVLEVSSFSAPVLQFSRPVKPVVQASTLSSFSIQPFEETDLRPCASLCVRTFFGEPNGNPVRSVLLSRLEKEQLKDLSRKFRQPGSSLFKMLARENSSYATNTNLSGSCELCGVVELSVLPAFRFLGENIPVASKDGRPVLSNLAIDEKWRRKGFGSSLVRACEEEARRRGFTEVVLQVDEDNKAAREFYDGLGYSAVFCDRAARRYELSEFTLRTARTSRITMRKDLGSQQKQGILRGLNGIGGFLRTFSLRPGTPRPVWTAFEERTRESK